MRHLIAIILLVILLIGCGLAQPTTHAAPWSVQLSTAQLEAAKVDPDAVLVFVSASPEDYRRLDGSLRITFRFETSANEPLTVSFTDTHIQTTLKRDAHNGQSKTTTPAERDAMRSAITTVRLSPADVLQPAIPEGQAFQAQLSAEVISTVALLMHPQIQQTFGIPAVWQVDWVGPANQHYTLWVHPQTNKVLARTDGELPQRPIR
jgi:hypothetical protein